MNEKVLEARMLAASTVANEMHGHFSRTRNWELAYANVLVSDAAKDAAAWRDLLNSAMTEPTKFVCSVPEAAGKVVGMTLFNGTVFIAAEYGVFRLVGDELVPVPFATQDPDHAATQKS